MKQIFHRFVGVFRFIMREIHAKLNPLGFARSIGVRTGDNVHFYGMPSGMFGTEPWLITLGNNIWPSPRGSGFDGVTESQEETSRRGFMGVQGEFEKCVNVQLSLFL